MTVVDWQPEHGDELAPDEACHTTCGRFARRPDRDDPAVQWCTSCGACIGTPAPRAPGLAAQLEATWLNRAGPFGYPTDNQPAPVGRGLVDEHGVTIPTTEGAA